LVRAAGWLFAAIVEGESAKVDASRGLVAGYNRMDVLIVERDDLVAEILVDALTDDGITASVVRTEQDAARIPEGDLPSVVITGMNRSAEDMKGMETARRLCSRWRCLGIIYMAALWPVRLREEALMVTERFLAKPVSMTKMTGTVRELLGYPGETKYQPG
jgi:DNA-binding response OmpR family regulator